MARSEISIPYEALTNQSFEQLKTTNIKSQDKSNSNFEKTDKMSTTMKTTQPDSYRFQSDIRQYGGLLMLLSFSQVVMPLVGIVSAFGPNGANTNDPSQIPFWGMIAGLFVFIFGVTGVFTGYMATVHDWSNKYLNIFLMIIIQTAWIGYITDMTAVSKGAMMSAEMNGFIPVAYNPEDVDVKFVGAMGVLGIMVYGFGFVGSMAFMVFSLNAYTTGKPESRSGNYFRGRMMMYSVILALAGFFQFLLGTWCQARFNMNTLENGPIAVAFFIVSYPGSSMYIGRLQMVSGVWGIARARGYLNMTKYNIYQFVLGFQWINVLVLQDIAQIGYLPAGMLAPVAPFLACFSLGLTLMPAYLDHKMNTLPDTFPEDYYTINVSMDSVDPLEYSEDNNDDNNNAVADSSV